MQEVTKLAFDAAGLLQDSAESVGEELRGIQGGSLHPGARGGPHGITAPQTRSGEQVRRGVTAPPDPHGVMDPQACSGVTASQAHSSDGTQADGAGLGALRVSEKED